MYYFYLLLMIGLSVFLFVLLYRSDRQRKLFQNQMFQPKLTFAKYEDENNLLLEIIPLLDALSFSSKKILITKMFGRPVRFLTGSDVDGSEWFESVTFFETNSEQEQSYHLNKLLDKEDPAKRGIL